MIKVHNIDVYRCTVIFIVGEDERELDLFYYDNVKRMTDEERNEIVSDMRNPRIDGCVLQTDSGSYIVWLSRFDNESVVAHEIYHVANKILCQRGVNHDADGEPWAYLIGHLTEVFYNWRRELQKND